MACSCPSALFAPAFFTGTMLLSHLLLPSLIARHHGCCHSRFPPAQFEQLRRGVNAGNLNGNQAGTAAWPAACCCCFLGLSSSLDMERL